MSKILSDIGNTSGIHLKNVTSEEELANLIPRIYSKSIVFASGK